MSQPRWQDALQVFQQIREGGAGPRHFRHKGHTPIVIPKKIEEQPCDSSLFWYRMFIEFYNNSSFFGVTAQSNFVWSHLWTRMQEMLPPWQLGSHHNIWICKHRDSRDAYSGFLPFPILKALPYSVWWYWIAMVNPSHFHMFLSHIHIYIYRNGMEWLRGVQTRKQ